MAELKAILVTVVIVFILQRFFTFSPGEYVIINYLLYWKLTELIEKGEQSKHD
jgi:hypothetical protein